MLHYKIFLFSKWYSNPPSSNWNAFGSRPEPFLFMSIDVPLFTSILLVWHFFSENWSVKSVAQSSKFLWIVKKMEFISSYDYCSEARKLFLRLWCMVGTWEVHPRCFEQGDNSRHHWWSTRTEKSETLFHKSQKKDKQLSKTLKMNPEKHIIWWLKTPPTL